MEDLCVCACACNVFTQLVFGCSWTWSMVEWKLGLGWSVVEWKLGLG